MTAEDDHARGLDQIDEARRRIEGLSASSLIAASLEYLRQAPDDGVEWYQRAPFISLLIIKWAAELAVPDDPRPVATRKQFEGLGNLLWEANGNLVRPRQITIFMRRLAFQQIWYQHGFDNGSIPRQAVLFGQLMRESQVVREFVEHHGIEPEDFVRQLGTMAAQMGELTGNDSLLQLRPAPGEDDQAHWEAVKRFFEIDAYGLHQLASGLAAYRTPRDVEICEQTPLIQVPFLLTRRGAESIHHKLLYRALETKLYDLLRGVGPEKFMRDFGPAFERYIERVLQELGLELIVEEDLQVRLATPGKCVDFALLDEDILVLVDSKGIEGHYDELYHNLPEVLTDKLRTSALHATDQAVETLRRLPADLVRPLTVFLCVTYKQFNIGDGDALRALTEGTDEWDSVRWQHPDLPPAHMFTISIQELELLCGAIRRGHRLADIFRQILQDNQAAETSKLLFLQHLARFGSVDIPDFARVAAAELCGI